MMNKVIEKYSVYYKKFPVPLEKIMEELDIDFEVNANFEVDTPSILDFKDKPKIKTHTKYLYSSQRFLAASMLGHYLKHKDSLHDKILMKDENNRIDKFCGFNHSLTNFQLANANGFAVNLLIPDSLLTRYMNDPNTDKSLSGMAKAFNVPESVMKQKIK